MLNKGEAGERGEKMEILRLFLETADFSQLRTQYEKHLLKKKRVKFIIYLANGKPEYEMKITQEKTPDNSNH